MKAGERVQLVKMLAAALSDMSEEDRNLTLRQFGFPNQWEADFSTPYMYSIHMLEKSKNGDGGLLELHEFLYPDATVSPAAQGPWKAGRFRLFMGHESAKKRAVAE